MPVLLFARLSYVSLILVVGWADCLKSAEVGEFGCLRTSSPTIGLKEVAVDLPAPMCQTTCCPRLTLIGSIIDSRVV